MEDLVIANIRHRPMRALITATGMAVGIVLMLIIVGLAHGMLSDRSSREASMAAEVIVRPAGSFSAGAMSNNLSMEVANAEKLRQLPGVKAVTPLGQYMQNTETGIGFRIVEAIEFDSYVATTGISMVTGQAPSNDNEVIVDDRYAQEKNITIGSTVKALDKEFKLVGIYTPAVGARIKVRLPTLQATLGQEGRCTMLLVRCQDSSQQEAIAGRISNMLADTQIIFTKDLPRLYSEGIPALNIFLKVLIILSIFISTLVILLAMYTAITERTKEIGILKSLGASKSFIIWIIEKEALAISALGVLLGYVLAFLTKFGLEHFTSLNHIEFELRWILITASIGLLGGLLGALYPAIYAASKDPVEALSYE